MAEPTPSTRGLRQPSALNEADDALAAGVTGFRGSVGVLDLVQGIDALDDRAQVCLVDVIGEGFQVRASGAGHEQAYARAGQDDGQQGERNGAGRGRGDATAGA